MGEGGDTLLQQVLGDDGERKWEKDGDEGN